MYNLDIFSAIIFGVSITHIFFAGLIKKKIKNKILHIMFDVELVFMFWSIIYLLTSTIVNGLLSTVKELATRHYNEPLFIFIVMSIASNTSVINFSESIIKKISIKIPLNTNMTFFFLTLILGPLLGSLITEPAAMTVTATLLGLTFFKYISDKAKYLLMGLLFVNVSIGGTLTHFAAPPILMIADKWNFTTLFMLKNFGFKAILAILVSTTVVSLLLKKEILKPQFNQNTKIDFDVSLIINMVLIFALVYFSNSIPAMLAIFAIYILVHIKKLNTVKLRDPLLVSIFLLGLIILGNKQSWWIEPIIKAQSPERLFFMSAMLTSFTDNAALTYLASLVTNLSEAAKYFIVSGAVVGGGLTIIANAPNPAGFSILKKYFKVKQFSHFKLFLGALIPTIIALLVFYFIK